jgi:16S rRNA (guanine527-N7)-methyltransferase
MVQQQSGADGMDEGSLDAGSGADPRSESTVVPDSQSTAGPDAAGIDTEAFDAAADDTDTFDAAAHELAMAGRCDLNEAILVRGGEQLGFGADLGPDVVQRLARYASEIVVANDRVNLTRILRPDEIALRHFLDSFICLRGLGELADLESLSCIDVGAGAGLPGLALALARPNWRITLVESVGKKADFLRHVCALPSLGLAERSTVLAARAEDVGRDPAHREVHDLVLARALAPMPILVEYLLPLLRLGGRCLALKGADIGAEMAQAERAIQVLGGRLVELQPYTLPGMPEPRTLVVIEKIARTQAAYPRRAGLPSRRPIGPEAMRARKRKPADGDKRGGRPPQRPFGKGRPPKGPAGGGRPPKPSTDGGRPTKPSARGGRPASPASGKGNRAL